MNEPNLVGGECTGGRGVPANCSWRVVAEVKRVAKECSDASVNSYVWFLSPFEIPYVPFILVFYCHS